MTEYRKARIGITAVYKNGEFLEKDHDVPAKVTVQAIPKVPSKFRELQLRMVVDGRHAEELLEGIVNGKVSLQIEGMLTAVERVTSGK